MLISKETVALPDFYVVERKMFWLNMYCLPWPIILDWLHSRIQNDKLDLHLYELKPKAEKAA